MGIARPLPSSPPPLLFLAFSFSLFSLSSFLDDEGVNKLDLLRDFLDVVGVELGVGKSFPSLSLPGTESVSIVDGGVLRSSAKLSADPRALPDCELSPEWKEINKQTKKQTRNLLVSSFSYRRQDFNTISQNVSNLVYLFVCFKLCQGFFYLCDVRPMALRCFSAGGATDEEVDPVETIVLLAVAEEAATAALLLLLLVLLLPLLVVLLLLPVTL